jgi:tRNA dimethylallyltransferase
MAKIKPKIVVISGITASGKTALSVKIAKKFDGGIISCDSRQVYKYLDIGTAKITADEMEGVPHYLLNVADPTENERYTLADFVRETDRAIKEILSHGKLPILVGGTGLYSRAVIDGYSFPPSADQSADQNTAQDAPPFTKRSEINPRHSGIKTHNNNPKYECLQICLLPPKDIITPKVRERNETRIKNGMFTETEALLKMGVKPEFLLNLGLEYALNVRYLNHEISQDEYKTLLFNQTMQFIKRQRTWYRRENPAITHYLTDPKEYIEKTTALITEFIK